MVPVVDVSEFQGNLDANVTKAAGIQGVYCRAAHGLPFDRKFNDYVFRLNAVGLPVGAYHFIEPGQASAKAHADTMIAACHGKPLTLPCMVDVERQVATSWVQEYIARLIAAGLRVGTIYLNDSSGLDLRPLPASYDLTAPDYCKGTPPAPSQWFDWAHSQKPQAPGIPIGWTTWGMWQFSADGNGQAARYGFTGASTAIDLDVVRPEVWARWVDDEPLTLADANLIWGV